MISIILPVYKEPYLNKTIASILRNAVGEIEIIVVLDGYRSEVPIIKSSRVRVIYQEHKGMRGAYNTGFANAKGKYIMKLDAHCAVAKGFDEVLKKDCKKNWIMVPRRYSLDEVNWKRREDKPFWDYHYLSFPASSDQTYGYSMQVFASFYKNSKEIDDTMTIQGSGWIANRKYFMEHVGLLDDSLDTYGTFAQDQQEICLKYWLGGGEVKINKNTWYAHLSKRGYHYKKGVFTREHKKDKYRIHGDEWGTKHWMNNEEPDMIHPFSWLVKKFWPIKGWPDNWEEIWRKHT